MMDRKVLATAIVGVLGASAIVSAAEPTASELREQIEALQSKVAKIEAREAVAADQQATIASILNDAERRSSLLQAGGVTAGFNADKRFFIGSGDNMIMPILQFQARNVTNWRDEAKNDGEDDISNGFEIRRMKFGFEGTLFSKDIGYKFQWQTNRNGGAVSLDEGYVTYKFADNLTGRIGQFKDPLHRESLTSASRLLANERSYLANVLFFNDNYVQGASLTYADGPLTATLALTDGAGNSNANFQDPPTGSDANYGVATRVDYVVFGDGKLLKDFSGVRGKEDTLGIGLGIDYTEAEQTLGGTTQTILYTADALWKNASGLSLYGSFNGRWADSSTDESVNDWGVVLQASYRVDDNIEPFARYSYISFDSAVPTGFEDTVHEITVGANYYLYGHNAKITLDLTYLPNGAPFADGGSDILVEDESEIVFRGQFQLAL